MGALTFCSSCSASSTGHWHLGNFYVPIRSRAYLTIVVSYLQRHGHPNLVVNSEEKTKLRIRNLTTWEAHSQSEQSLRFLCRQGPP